MFVRKIKVEPAIMLSDARIYHTRGGIELRAGFE
jgi:hypothetical protein